jgi:hypothetical protein
MASDTEIFSPQSARAARRYAVLTLACAALLLAAAAALIQGSLALGRVKLPYQRLLEYQTAKLSGPPTQTIFIGDSSLGHAIDAQLWSTLSGQRALNLALTGSYGYEGGYNFIKRALQTIKPKNIVLMYTADMMTRPLSEEAFETTRDLAELAWWERIQRYLKETFNFTELSSSVSWLRRAVIRGMSGREAPAERIIENDYVKQGPPRPPPQEVLVPAQIQPDKIKYYALIGKLCETQQINCLYLHGPLARLTCEQSRPYFDELARLFSQSGIRQVTAMPICLQPDEVGDSEDHVVPALKPAFTRRYYEMLKPYLVP